MWIKFEGLDELIKEFESVSSEKEIDKANVKIIKECAKVVEKILSQRFIGVKIRKEVVLKD